MKKYLEHIIKKSLLAEQDAPADDAAAATPLETDNAPSDAKDSPFTPAEERFLGKFDAYGSNHLGILYSTSDAGVREFIARSGKELNVSPGILRSLFRKKIIKFVPYTGFGRNDDYTIELQLSLDDVKGLGKADQAKAETGSQASGAAPAGGGAPPPPPENAGVVRIGDVLSESLNENDSNVTSSLKNAMDFWTDIADATEGWDYDEELWIDAFNKHVTSRKAAIMIDAFGTMMQRVDTASNPLYLMFLNKKINNWRSINLPLTIKSFPIYTIPTLIRETGEWVLDEDSPIIKTLNNRGVAKIDMSAKFINVYPTYNQSDVNAAITELLKSVRTKNIEIAEKSKFIKSKIENNKNLYSKSYINQQKKNSEFKIPTNLSKITDMQASNGGAPDQVTYKGTWLDSNNVAYVWFKGKQHTWRLYLNGTLTIVDRRDLDHLNFQWKFNSPTEIIY